MTRHTRDDSATCSAEPIACDEQADNTNGTWLSTYHVPKMDCPSEERMIRLALEGVPGVRALRFDLAERRLQATHDGPADVLTERLLPLQLGATLEATTPAAIDGGLTKGQGEDSTAPESRVLKQLLAINGVMFVIELVMGLVAQSAGLLADSLDMLADAFVYGIALYAVGKTAQHKLTAAHLAGWLQMALALGALTETGRRFLFGSEPQSMLMMGVAGLALVANVTCLWLISAHRDRGVHLRASWIFSSNDVLANAGVIVAGALVAWTHSPYPDLVIGTVIGVVVLNGARRILALKG